MLCWRSIVRSQAPLKKELSAAVLGWAVMDSREESARPRACCRLNRVVTQSASSCNVTTAGILEFWAFQFGRRSETCEPVPLCHSLCRVPGLTACRRVRQGNPAAESLRWLLSTKVAAQSLLSSLQTLHYC